MRKKLLFLTPEALVLIAILAIVVTSFTVPKKRPVSITGTWELVSYKYGPSSTSFIDVPQSSKRIKVINETHFIWVHYDTLRKRIYESAGGTYTLSGNSYTENLDFGLGMDNYLKTSPVYSVKIEGDILFLTGLLAKDYKIEEIWKRIK